MKITLPFFLLFFLLAFSSCERGVSKDTLKKQLQEVKVKLIQELRMVETSKQFEEHESQVSDLFEDIAECMICVNHLPKEGLPSFSKEDFEISDELHTECSRILALPGGESWLMKCQAGGVRLLDKELRIQRGSKEKNLL